MGKKRWLLGIVTALLVGFASPKALAETILYVPQDDRPVSLDYTVDTVQDAGYTVITPPRELISGSNFHGEADKIWQWVDNNIKNADIMVLSTDTLIYGGLVDSRKHNIPQKILESRLKKIKSLKDVKDIPIYAFGTIMRSPRGSSGGVEPAYYSEYGPQIFRIAALQDKKDSTGLTEEEEYELFSLISAVPVEYVQDWFARRHTNMTINEQMIDLVRNHSFKYFALGHDDTSYLSQSALESRYLKEFSKGMSYREYGSFPGADQLGLLLMARAHVDLHNYSPNFMVIYPLGGAEKTIPHYEDQPVGITISQHIEAVGGNEIKSGKPEYLLAVNTPLSTETGEAYYFNNLPIQSNSIQQFVDKIEGATKDGIVVGVADIAYSNGASNLLTRALQQRDLLYKIGAYDGWNTASNTIGYAIAQAIFADDMTVANHNKMLTQQYLDNWGYQSNIRKNLSRLQDEMKANDSNYNGQINERLIQELKEEMQDFAKRELNINPRMVDADFPWNRLFETDVIVYDSEKAPDYKAQRLAREEAERKAREEAERKAREEAEYKAKIEALQKQVEAGEEISAEDKELLAAEQLKQEQLAKENEAVENTANPETKVAETKASENPNQAE